MEGAWHISHILNYGLSGSTAAIDCSSGWNVRLFAIFFCFHLCLDFLRQLHKDKYNDKDPLVFKILISIQRNLATGTSYSYQGVGFGPWLKTFSLQPLKKDTVKISSSLSIRLAEYSRFQGILLHLEVELLSSPFSSSLYAVEVKEIKDRWRWQSLRSELSWIMLHWISFRKFVRHMSSLKVHKKRCQLDACWCQYYEQGYIFIYVMFFNVSLQYIHNGWSEWSPVKFLGG